MKDKFDELLDAVEKNIEFCPWVKESDLEKYHEAIVSEADEIKNAFQNNDKENIKEELGDILWDILTAIRLGERDGHFESKDIVESVIKKFKRRKPFIFENKTVTLEEGNKIWNEAKAKEKGVI